ncbi:MAG: universal stress protein [Bacteroidota bacterium]
MKTILVPTDFSETAANALEYAAELAAYTQSKLILFHAYHIPAIVTEVPFVTTSQDFQLEERSNEQLKLVVKDLSKRIGPKLNVEYISSAGLLSDIISEIVKEKNCDIIVMGTQGAGGSNVFLGSNTMSVIKNTRCNLLAIPDKVKFRNVDKVVLAFDYVSIQNTAVFSPLIELSSTFNSEILIFNMLDSRLHPALEKETAGVQLERALENVKHTYWFSEKENIVEAINSFAATSNAVMIAMIRRHHNFFQQIFTKSNTGQMALYSHLPLLILHEDIAI